MPKFGVKGMRYDFPKPIYHDGFGKSASRNERNNYLIGEGIDLREIIKNIYQRQPQGIAPTIFACRGNSTRKPNAIKLSFGVQTFRFGSIFWSPNL